MSTHNIFFVPVKLEKHPNADTLSVVRVFGWNVVVKTSEWASREHGIYIPPDYVVPDTESFAWLNGHGSGRRIRVRRFRGEMSQGLLVPLESFPDVDTMKLVGNIGKVPVGEGMPLDAELYSVKRYEAVNKFITGGEAVSGPNEWCPVYDIESWYQHSKLLVPGEEVVITEKIHGANARFTSGFCGSRREWKSNEEGSIYWKAYNETQGAKSWCECHEPTQSPYFSRGFVYGEIYGWVQDLRYDMDRGQVKFAAFDIFDNGRFVDYDVFQNQCRIFKIPMVPELYRGPYDPAQAVALASGQSTIASHIREGVVIRPVQERQDSKIGRVILKIVSNEYLEKAQ